MKLFYNPASSYSQKTLMAFFEKNVPFEPVVVNLFDPQSRADYRKKYPVCKVPLLELGAGQSIPESTSIIEYLEHTHPSQGTKLIPADAERAREVRMRDRFFDFYLNDTMQKVFFDGLRPAGKNDPFGVADAKSRIEGAYEYADQFLAGRTWAAGEEFSMADCAAAPALGYLRMVQPFDGYKNVAAYAGRVLERPSYKRAMEEAAPLLAQMGFGKK